MEKLASKINLTCRLEKKKWPPPLLRAATENNDLPRLGSNTQKTDPRHRGVHLSDSEPLAYGTITYDSLDYDDL